MMRLNHPFGQSLEEPFMTRRVLSFSLAWCACTFLPSTPAAARFDLADEATIDSEELLHEETIMDMANYRPRPSWRETWDTGINGFRFSAGSVTQTRFFYDEDIRLESTRKAPVTLGFSQRRVQTPAESRLDREIRLQANTTPADAARPWHASLLADGNTWKAEGDIGLALGTHDLEGSYWDLYAWSIDPFYNKKGPTYRHYVDQPRALGFRGRERHITGLGVLLWSFSYEPGLILEDDILHTRYSYAATQAQWSLTYPLSEAWSLRWDAQHDTKEESREALGEASQTSPFKRLSRATHTDDFALINPRRDLEFGLLHSLRLADYDQRGWNNPRSVIFERSDPSHTRQEILGYAFWDFYGEGEMNRLRTGVMGTLGRLSIPEQGNDFLLNEGKINTGWEFHRDNLGIVAATSWDLDLLVENLLAGKKHRLWDGGNLQFQMTL
jgi:hypothetical protein